MWDAVRRQLREQQRLERGLPPVRTRAASGSDGAAGRLSVTQQRLWRLDRVTATGRLSYNVTYPLDLCGDLDMAALRGAVQDLVTRHEALRTSFVEDGRGPVRLVGEPDGVPVEVTDLSGCTAAVTDEWLNRSAAHRFELADAPLLRVFVGRHTAAEHLVLLVGHHGVLDGRSVSVLLGELGVRYNARVLGRPGDLVAPAAQAGDFIGWQWSWLGSAAGEPYRAYLQRQLTSPEYARGGSTLGRPANLDFSGGRVECEIPAPVRQRVVDLAGRLDVPAISVYLAAYQALMHAYTAERFLVCGLPAANRGRPELAQLVGFLVNVVPVASELRTDCSVPEAVRATDQTLTEAYVHQAMPVEYLTPPLRPDLDPGALPIDVFFAAYRRVVKHPLSMAGLTLSPAPSLSTKDVEFPFMMTVMELGARAVAALSYGHWMVTPAQAARLVAAYVLLLDRASAAPDEPLQDYAAVAVRPC